MNEKLILSDVTEFANSHALESGRNLFVYISDGESGLREVFDALIDPEKTAHIEYHYSAAILNFDGFTKLVAVRDEGDGLITAVLYKPNEARLASDGE